MQKQRSVCRGVVTGIANCATVSAEDGQKDKSVAQVISCTFLSVDLILFFSSFIRSNYNSDFPAFYQEISYNQ